MRRLLDTLRGRKQRRNDQETDVSQRPPPSLPFLPAQRSRPITPTTISADNDVAALGNFARLSPELRRRVLIAAFGERTLHVDLRLAPRGQRVNMSEFSSAPYEHGRGTAPLSYCRTVIPIETTTTTTRVKTAKSTGSKAKTGPEWEWEWRWYGCVCHRLLPRGSAIERRFIARGTSPYMWPHREACLRGEAMMCQLWSSGPDINGTQAPETGCDASVGAMGWLRACRQAYVEGAEVLYATNTFVLESWDLINAFFNPTPGTDRHLLLPHHLAMIRSLELRWDVVLFGDTALPPLSHPSEKDKMRCLPNLTRLMVTFPKLRSLVISFSDRLYNYPSVRPAARLPEIERLLLQPLALTFRHLAPQQEKPAVVELPSNVFDDLKGLGLEEEQRGEEWGDGKGSWLRYPIDDSVYFYIKQGDESDLYWDHDGNPRWVSSAVNHTDPRLTHVM
ncbi:hypothetical protein CkaCkLH20_05690 [Colletotrichum karsti]|uniref:DUF7730 domain-containing protein n=1 Tax=Colletotrichum karsti TaxID=1095194 RepID=A0A9P6I5Y2_9PEZI|nr:uncharacterized protein CkaCkLH20_05690 [Colletotrichum karsti]KAF9876844.1 hypothetical protein CkaCkLH20_05690 [Colletotrichum karsti]